MLSIAQVIASLDDDKMVSLLQKLMTGHPIDTGQQRLGEFLMSQAKRHESGLGKNSLCVALERLLNHTLVEFFLDNANDEVKGYPIHEIINLASQCQSVSLARTLFRCRLSSQSIGRSDEFDACFGEDLVRATRESCHDAEVANQAISLCSEERYEPYTANLYFALLELSAEKSTQLVPGFVSHYFDIQDEHVREVYHKNLQYFFATNDIGGYIDRLTPELGKSFWVIVIRTNLSRRLIAVPSGVEDPSIDAEMPPNKLVLVGATKGEQFLATSDSNDVKILSAQVDEAARNPDLVRNRAKELLDQLASSQSNVPHDSESEPEKRHA